ncbi:MAG: helix-turn-helix domain-containing protein, partial [bacterium]|nr:helix-turn-helix domain-containing protein [bacterium]
MRYEICDETHNAKFVNQLPFIVMLLTIEQSATRLGKSARQIRYLIKSERLPAKKISGRWVIESKDLPLSDKQTEALNRKERQLRSAVEEALGLPDQEKLPARYSVRDMKAFQIALPIQAKAAGFLGPDHPSSTALKNVLINLSKGCHRFDNREKSAAYKRARDAASLAICEL